MKASFAAALLLLPCAASAQVVGSTPEQSPFRDIAFKQEITTFAGIYAAQADPAGVAPGGGPMVGARYEVRIGGPAQFTARIAHVWSERRMLDPELPPDTRDLGTKSLSLFLTDLGVSLNLTGQKSWHHLVPVLSAGIGIAANFDEADIGGYRFGTQFAFVFGGGVRWVPEGKPYQLRVDIADYLYQTSYPDAYANPVSTTADPPITGSSSAWTHNAAITVGASYRFFR